MKHKLRYTTNQAMLVQKVIIEQLSNIIKPFEAEVRTGEIELKRKLKKEEMDELGFKLAAYGIHLIEDRQSNQLQQIKDVILDMINTSENLPNMTTSNYLETRLNMSYSNISKIFKEGTYSSIENYIIIQKVERAKELIIADRHTLTEIAHILNYSSVAHLSNQFKKTTGLNASAFLRIIKKRDNPH
jgi:AraC-like DNA-binding protein